MGKLGIKPASIEPKATEHMTEIIELTDRLDQEGLGLFQLTAMCTSRSTSIRTTGAFRSASWKSSRPVRGSTWMSASAIRWILPCGRRSKPGEPSWPSPWGAGRPGWHIECSAMSIKHLGETFDIHGGGMDLIFPHHENEIAQSCGATGKEFADYWIHNGFVQINQEKMSKSLGNFFTIREIFEKSEWSEKITGEMLRYFLLSTHYRSPVGFFRSSFEEAK